MTKYATGVTSGHEEPLKFTFYVPAGYENVAGQKVLNIEVTADPEKILTASFAGGQEIWAGAKR